MYVLHIVILYPLDLLLSFRLNAFSSTEIGIRDNRHRKAINARRTQRNTNYHILSRLAIAGDSDHNAIITFSQSDADVEQTDKKPTNRANTITDGTFYPPFGNLIMKYASN